VLITKLDTSGAVAVHQYKNRFIDAHTFEWTSQNRMSRDNDSGRAITEHEANGNVIRLFVQAGSHSEACYLGEGRCVRATGDNPMVVRFELERAASQATLKSLGVVL
jgi:hypothetical protein